PECKYPHTASAAECADLGVAPDTAPTLFTAQGCSSCNFTGYQGRTAIFEVIEINDRLRALIHDQVSEQELEDYAHGRGTSIYQDGIRRVLAGDTTHEEVLRVTHEDG